ncbi:SDR family oxidoreductase [Serratia entomophila]|uniref:SDR family oxidoreductase n=1 Tax=Serratia entomophila TaxID=42906 RepID=UPI0021776864|nr:SDR family oxidoreductase [Serratia entomophila]CAI0763095.1 NAD dependent epimerase/dehydratase family [Serratia entomophila]CAI1502548.1 NAD dependent epimerase/dehydratase family [Serratia entomophila]CAI1505040.1 NAD dependent epimerase/dehydratase family [Serratia entomophila]CAI1514919.1 NAD dependent epimerase/dehydratase family [Serratia entomophila]CAI1623448.1 NAD dependent epimerase/dehydratase family [Serratia entomophila]
MANHNQALVAGANGVIGRDLIAELERQGWAVTGLSRRGGQARPRVRYLAVDLLDEQATRAELRSLTGISHVFYTAYQDAPDWAGLVAPNMRMLQNLVEAIEPVAPALQHISLMQGYKVYGAHLGPFKTPARESDAGHMPPEFNVDQQNYLEHRRRGKNWRWSAIRPSVVGGFSLGNPMNLALSIAVYASISKALGLPLRFPGKAGAYHSLLEMTDAGLLARATLWAATDPAAADQAFNINNGDLFRWSEMWPKIAAYFAMETAPPLPMSLELMMADKAGLWRELAQQYQLSETDYGAVAGWRFADFVFSWDYDMFADGSKARRFGFHQYAETEAMFFALFDEFRRRRIIP